MSQNKGKQKMRDRRHVIYIIINDQLNEMLSKWRETNKQVHYRLLSDCTV